MELNHLREIKQPDEIKKGLETCIGKCTGNKPHCPYHSCGDGCMDAMNRDTLAYIRQLEAQVPKWISVKDGLPEIGEIVLAYVDELRLIIRAKIVDAKDYRGERRIDWARVDPDTFFLSCYTITHWMPLPEPPEKETGHV